MDKRPIQQGDKFVVHYTNGESDILTLDFIQDQLWYFTGDLPNKTKGVLNTQSSAIYWIELLKA